MAWTTWNPSDKVNVVLSNSNLTATYGVAGGTPFVRAIDGQTTGKYFFELYLTTGPGGLYYGSGGGIALASAASGSYVGIAADVSYGQGDQGWNNNSNVWSNTASSFFPNNIGVCVDLTNNLIWLNSDLAQGGGTYWNNSGTANPNTGAGGLSIAWRGAAAVYPFLQMYSAGGEVWTANFGQNGFSRTVPTGFTAGWPGSGPTLPTNLIQIGATLSSVTMQWTQGGGVSPSSYTLQYRKTGTSIWTQITGIAGTTQVISGLTASTNYDVQVQQIVSGIASGFTPTTIATTASPTIAVPPQPQALSNVPHATGGVYRGQVGINYNGMVIIGDAFAGVVGKMDFNVFTEYGNTMQALITSPPIHDDRKRIFLTRFELDIETGVGLSLPENTQGVQPLWILDWSKDGGRTFGSPQLFRSMGRVGEYLTRLRWLRLGHSRQWILRLRSTDPVRRVIIGTYVDVAKGSG